MVVSATQDAAAGVDPEDKGRIEAALDKHRVLGRYLMQVTGQ